MKRFAVAVALTFGLVGIAQAMNKDELTKYLQEDYSIVQKQWAQTTREIVAAERREKDLAQEVDAYLPRVKVFVQSERQWFSDREAYNGEVRGHNEICSATTSDYALHLRCSSRKDELDARESDLARRWGELTTWREQLRQEQSAFEKRDSKITSDLAMWRDIEQQLKRSSEILKRTIERLKTQRSYFADAKDVEILESECLSKMSFDDRTECIAKRSKFQPFQ